MLRKIVESISFPIWAGESSRWRRLDVLDRILDGKLYDHLKFAYYDEQDGRKSTVPIEQRRPSAQYRLPRMVSRWTARRMFAARHQPKIGHPDKTVARRITKYLEAIQFWPTMLCAAYFGSVGAVAITFRKDENGQLALKVRRAKLCTPTIDEQNELVKLRLHIPATGDALNGIGAPGPIEDDGKYWFIRDYTPTEEITYQPIKQADWNPEQGFTTDEARKKGFVRWDDECTEHELKFVPAAWIVNLVGGERDDGSCTWEDAIPNSIDIDYTLSQAGRGIRYNCAPQPVIKGNLVGSSSGDMTRSPTEIWQVQAGYKDESGMTYGDGDAKLLEMNGHGIEAAHKHIDKLRELALESIAASRKSPEHMKGILSGRAMEFLEEDAHDLIMDMRTQYGDRGALPLLRKIVQVGMDEEIDVAQLTLQWPRLFQPTPEDLGTVIPALVQAITPVAPTPDPNAEPAAAAPSGDGSEPKPKPKPKSKLAQHANVGKAILTIEEVSAWLRSNMDLGLLDAPDDLEETDESVSERPAGVSEEQDVADDLASDADRSVDTDTGGSDNNPVAPEGVAPAAAAAGAQRTK